jgi:hypothetical protein
MIIGTVRPEEARAFDSEAGFHRWPGGGSFEVFWDDSDIPRWGGEPRNYDGDGKPVRPGWYWWACHPGCLPDGEAHGPFARSSQAKDDALEE